MGIRVSRTRRQELGHILLALSAVMQEQGQTLARLQGLNMTQLTRRELKVLRGAGLLADRSAIALRGLATGLLGRESD